MKLLKIACASITILSTTIAAKAALVDELIPNIDYGYSGTAVRASLYGAGEKLRSHTACGHHFNPWGLTVAHRSFPCGTRLKLSYNGRSIIATVNDRGPAAWTGKSLDLTVGAARQLGFPGKGSVYISRLN